MGLQVNENKKEGKDIAGKLSFVGEKPRNARQIQLKASFVQRETCDLAAHSSRPCTSFLTFEPQKESACLK